MAETLQVPFRFAAGKAAKVDARSDAGLLQQVAVLLMTRLGERPMRLALGVHDPTWHDLDLVEANSALRTFGSGVRLARLSAEWADATTRRLVIEAERL